MSKLALVLTSIRGMEVDFDLKRIYDMANIEQLIFFFVNFDKCRGEIIRYEDALRNFGGAGSHPKESKKQALDLMRCHSKK